MKDGGSVGRRTYGDERGKGVVQEWGVGGGRGKGTTETYSSKRL